MAAALDRELADSTSAEPLGRRERPGAVYGPDGYFVPNDAGRYSVNDVTAQRDPDGGITVTFGAEGPNSIPVSHGWN